MNTFKSVLITAAALSIAVIASLFTASLVLAFAGVATVLLAARAIAVRMQPKEARIYARARNNRYMQPVRVWNDGKGTIIDM